MKMFDTQPLKLRAKQLSLFHASVEDIDGRRHRDTGVRALLVSRGLEPSYLYRPRLSLWVIDRYCIALGCHPLELYPDFCEDAA